MLLGILEPWASTVIPHSESMGFLRERWKCSSVECSIPLSNKQVINCRRAHYTTAILLLRPTKGWFEMYIVSLNAIGVKATR